MLTSIDDGVGDLSDTLIVILLNGNMWADDACVPIALADVATNDYGPDNIEAAERTTVRKSEIHHEGR